MNTCVRVGGLDPSLSNFGMSKGTHINGTLLIEDIGLVTTKESKDIKYQNERDLDRAATLMAKMSYFFADVDVIYIELPVGSQSSRAMASYGICVGVVAALVLQGKVVKRVSAKDVKVIATGNPQAPKADMIKWATEKYPNLPWLTRKLKGTVTYTNANEHIADSIAAIHAGLNNAGNSLT